MNDRPIQSPKNAWVLALRAEVLRPSLREQLTARQLRHLALIGTVGQWIASYADPDGSNTHPGRDTLAALAGCSVETVSRAVQVLVGLGVLQRRRRPNLSPMYQLLMPVGQLDWVSALEWFGNSRQQKWTVRKASTDAVRKASVDCVPDGVQGRSPSDPESVHGRPRKASVDAVRKASVDAPTTTHLPAVGDHDQDQAVADLQQPSTGRARASRRAGPIQPPLMAAVPDPPAEPAGPPAEYREQRAAERRRRARGA